jgi:hypothetical protein
MTLTDIHGRLANAAILYTILLVLWGFLRYFRRQGLDSSYWGALAIDEVLILVQGVLGVILYFSPGVVLERSLHILYGIVSAITIPSTFAFTKGREDRRDMLIYAVVLMFLTAILIRARMTGG